MKSYTQKKNGYTLEISLGKFDIYDDIKGETVCSGTVESFRGQHDEMRRWAIVKFDELTKKEYL